MPLFLPRHIVEQPVAAPASPLFGVYYGFQDLTGRLASPADLVRMLVPFRRSDVIRLIAWLSRLASNHAALQTAAQREIAGRVLRRDLLESLDRLVSQDTEPRWCIFHRRQLWLLLQMASVSCKESSPPVSEEQLLEVIGDCCLAANDILQQLEIMKPVGDSVDEANEWMTTLVVGFLDGADNIEILARAHAFWFDIPNTPPVLGRFAELNIPAFDTAFEFHYGLSLREFFVILYTVHLGFEAHAQSNPQPLLLNERAYLWSMFGEQNVRRVLRNFSQSPDEFAIKLFATARQNWSTDCTLLKEKPVIQVFDGQHACTDLSLLRRCLIDGIYYLLQRAYGKPFGQLFGYVFQEYITRLIKRFSYDGNALARTFYAAPRFEGKEDEAGDGILVWSNTALVMEYKARMLTTRERYGGNPTVLMDGIADIVGTKGRRKGVDQLARVVQRLLAGEKVVAGSPLGLDLRWVSRIHPVLVTYEQGVGLESVRQVAASQFNSALKIDNAARQRVGELLILTIDELEILDGLACYHAVEEVVNAYVAHIRANPTDRAGSFRSFIINSKYNQRSARSPETFVASQYRTEFGEISADIQKRYATAVDRGEISDDESQLTGAL